MENIIERKLGTLKEFKEANVAFMDSVTDQVGFYTTKAEEIFDMFEIDGSYATDGVRKNVQTWWDNKQNLLSIFRKHPLWNEENKAIIFTNDEIRKANYNKAYDMLIKLEEYVRDRVSLSANSIQLTDCFLDAFYYHKDATISEGFINEFSNRASERSVEIPRSVKSNLRVGVRISRFCNIVFKNLTSHIGEKVDATKLVDAHEDGDRSYKSYDKIFAKFADLLTDLTIKKITVMSINFNDFMTMSNGNSWSSCHFINSHGIFHEDAEDSYRGLYKQGCLSYALDGVSFIFYTLPSTYEGTEYYKQPKLTRMCCQYKNGVIITGKCYPNNEDELIDSYRQTIQKIISECVGFANLWTFSRKIDRISTFVKTAYNAAHYEDYFHSHQRPTISIHKPLEIDDIDNMQFDIGHESYCLHCGRTLYADNHDWLQCEQHRRKRICSRCGRVIEDDENLFEVDGEVYCEDCVFYCDYYGTHMSIERGMNTLETENGTITVCDDAMVYFKKCAKCGKWFRFRSMTCFNGEYYCGSCSADISALDGIVRKSEYSVGDYVVIANDISHCRYGASHNMLTYYPNRIVKITYASSTHYNASSLDGGAWSWDADCFVGAIVNGNDSMIGKKYWEIM